MDDRRGELRQDAHRMFQGRNVARRGERHDASLLSESQAELCPHAHLQEVCGHVHREADLRVQGDEGDEGKGDREDGRRRSAESGAESDAGPEQRSRREGRDRREDRGRPEGRSRRRRERREPRRGRDRCRFQAGGSGASPRGRRGVQAIGSLPRRGHALGEARAAGEAVPRHRSTGGRRAQERQRRLGDTVESSHESPARRRLVRHGRRSAASVQRSRPTGVGKADRSEDESASKAAEREVRSASSGGCVQTSARSQGQAHRAACDQVDFREE
mmetsp:Transcript_13470/g.50129  ORF Transcript_13470/g.50129 Transcript_13470/m.50129 type:complete len:274 (-) Transcript_13470:815-1636(-)